MKRILPAAVVAAFALGGFAHAADLASVDRTIKKEPAYQTKSPRYALLVFGPEARDRVWLVHDGDALYVDCNGDGDLTDEGEKIAAKGKTPHGHYHFPVDELRIGGRVHKGMAVSAVPLRGSSETVESQPNAKTALAGDPKAYVYAISDMATGKTVFDKLVSKDVRFQHSAFSPDGRRLAVLGQPKWEDAEFSREPDPRELPQPRVYLFDVANTTGEPEIIMCPHGYMGGLAFSPDGKILAVGGAGATHLFDLARKAD